MKEKVFITKQGKRPQEEFNPEKLHRSIVAACLSVHAPEGQADDTARRVTLTVMNWCQTRPSITSTDIRRHAAKTLRELHPDAAYLYEHYKHIV